MESPSESTLKGAELVAAVWEERTWEGSNDRRRGGAAPYMELTTID